MPSASDKHLTDSVAAHIRKLRGERHWSAQRLADQSAQNGPTAVSRGTLAKIEAGIRPNITLAELDTIAAALGILPEDLLRDAAGRPRAVKILTGPPVNPWFTGRDAMLEEIRAGLVVRRTHALCGPAGSGRTSLAREYVHRHGGAYDIVWWIDAADDEAARRGLSELAVAAEWTAHSTPVAERIRAVRARLANLPRWLLVFAGLRRPGDLVRLLNQDAGHVLLTSLESGWSDIAGVTPVGGFTRAESIAYLLRRFPRLPAAEANSAAQKYQDDPARLAEFVKQRVAGAWPAAAEPARTSAAGAGQDAGPRVRATLAAEGPKAPAVRVQLAAFLLDQAGRLPGGEPLFAVHSWNDLSSDGSTRRRGLPHPDETVTVTLQKVAASVQIVSVVAYVDEPVFPQHGSLMPGGLRFTVERCRSADDWSEEQDQEFSPPDMFDQGQAVILGEFVRGQHDGWTYHVVRQKRRDLTEIRLHCGDGVSVGR